MQFNPVAVASIVTGPLAIGSRGQSVTLVQEGLNRANVTPRLKCDGAFGINTDAAVRAFQKRKHLQVDGIVGPRTTAALGFRYVAGAPVPKPVNIGDLIGPILKNMQPPPPPPEDSAIAHLVQAVVQGIAEIEAGVMRIVNSMSELPDIVLNEIRSALADPFQTAISMLQACVRTAAGAVGAATGIISGAVRGSFQKVVAALQVVVGVLSKVADLLGLSGIVSKIQAIIVKMQRATDSIIDVITRTLAGVGRTIVDGITEILGIIRSAAAA